MWKFKLRMEEEVTYVRYHILLLLDTPRGRQILCAIRVNKHI